MADDEAFAKERELQESLRLLMRPLEQHWPQTRGGRRIYSFVNRDEEGTVYGNDWARGFMRGLGFHHAAWEGVFARSSITSLTH